MTQHIILIDNNNLILSKFYDGFYSCCSTRLHYIIHYFNKYKYLPIIYDTSMMYDRYKKDNLDIDITFDYFKDYKDINECIQFNRYINYNGGHQFIKFYKIDYEGLKPFIKKYFTPSDNILKIKKTIEDKYNIDYDNICVLFHRGNDKAIETILPTYDDYLHYAKIVFNNEKNNPKFKFLIQSDETEFLDEMKKNFPNHIIFYDEIRHMPKQLSTVDTIFKEKNNEYSKYFLAIMLIMSKCKYVITGNGNCSLWLYLFRGNLNNFVDINKQDF